MATLFLSVESDNTVAYVFVGAIATCFVAWIVLYIASPKARAKTHEVFNNIAHSSNVGVSKNTIRKLSKGESKELKAEIGVNLAKAGYVLQGRQSGVYTYTKDEKPNPLLAILLLFLCLIPGIVYLVAGRKTAITTIRFLEVSEGCKVNIEGPGKIMVLRTIRPYLIPPEPKLTVKV